MSSLPPPEAENCTRHLCSQIVQLELNMACPGSHLISFKLVHIAENFILESQKTLSYTYTFNHRPLTYCKNCENAINSSYVP